MCNVGLNTALNPAPKAWNMSVMEKSRRWDMLPGQNEWMQIVLRDNRGGNGLRPVDLIVPINIPQ